MKAWIILSGLLPVFIAVFTPAHGEYEDGDVRLVGGSYQWEGRVEVFMSGVWGTITDSDWTDEDATVVCRKLGHFRAGASPHSNAYFGEGQGPINLDSVVCSGSEYNLTECSIGNSGSSSSHSMDVGVKCQPADGSYRNGDLRLVGGSVNWEGRVEVYWNRVWGSVSDSQWSISEANVVCRQLKHESGAVIIPCCNNAGDASGDIILTEVVCSGSETRIISCNYQINSDSVLSHENDVQVQCQKGNDTNEGDIRLVGGMNLWEGRVEVFLSNEWGTVYDYLADSNDARVVCRQLGYATQKVRESCCSFGRGTGPIHLEYPRCGGSEYRLMDCGYRAVSQSRYTHRSDWSVFCSIDGPDPWDIQLSSGQLQIYLSEQWIPVANSHSIWMSNNSKVVCRELGYDPDSSSYYSYGTYYSDSPVTTIDNVTCTGDEYSLQNCDYTASTLVSPYSTVGVGCTSVSCRNGDIRLADGGNEAEGRVEICSNSRWGTVCDRRWTENATAVACKHLGYSEIVGESRKFTSARFGKGSGPVLVDYINCTGLEGSLWRWCNHFTHLSGCSHDSDVGIQCQPARCTDGQVRLTDIPEVTVGRVEICSDQRWKAFYSSHWFPTNARVACIELGFQDYGSWRSFYVTSGGPRHAEYYKCSGSELRLAHCESANETASRSTSYDVGMTCSNANCVDGEMRLVEGETEFEGRLEICYNRRWGIVGGDGWTDTNSRVVCNSLGYDTTNEPANQSTPMAPSKPLHYHSIRCSPRDLTLLECGYKKSSPYDYAEVEQQAIVKCKEPVCGDGDLRLVGGDAREEGRLEVCFGERWGTIDGDRWTQTDTEVACRQLGYSTSDVSYTKTGRTRYHASQMLPAFMRLVGCYGSEDRLVDCDYQEFPSSTSTTSTMDVSISCGSEEAVAQPSTVAMASLSISVILALVVIALVAIVVALLVIQRRRKRRDKDLPHSSTHHNPGTVRYSSSGIAFSNKTETVSMDKMVAEDLPAESYEEMETFNPPVPPKPQPKRPPNRAKPTPQKADLNRYAQGGNSRPNTGAKPQSQPHVQRRGQPRQPPQQPRPPSDSPEAIYECPDAPDDDYN